MADTGLEASTVTDRNGAPHRDPHAALDEIIEQHRQFVDDMETVRRTLARRRAPTPAQVLRLNAGLDHAFDVETRAQVAVWSAIDGYFEEGQIAADG